MKAFVLLVCALGLFAADKPSDLTDAEKLMVARAQVAELQAELAATRAEMAVMQARAGYESEIARQRAQHKAPAACDIDTQQGWKCPEVKPKSAPAPEKK